MVQFGRVGVNNVEGIAQKESSECCKYHKHVIVGEEGAQARN
jgi:hypothetical protein